MRAINATPVRLVGLVSLCLAAGALGGVSGALLVGRDPETPPRTATTVPTTPPSAPERLHASIEGALTSVVTILVDLPPSTNEQGQTIETQHFGTGVVLADGFVLTNQHVVEGAARIRVILPTGEEREAIQVADDAPFQDVALILTDDRGLRSARLGDSSSVRVGDPIAVISSGIVSYENQAKVGIISSADLQFPREGVILGGMLQTDAAVNNGDSGGALVDADGRVIGLVTSVVRANANGQAVEGVAMAHAINDVRPFIDAVVTTGINPRGRIGIERLGRHHLPLSPALAAELGVPLSAGAAIIAVEAESPAASAGIQAGDIVVSVGGQEVDDLAPFPNLLSAISEGASVTLTIWRDGATADVTLTPLPVRSAARSSE